MRSWAARALITLAIGASALPLAPASPAAAATAPLLGAPDCSEASWTGGVTETCRGTFIYRDYVYDDDGADTRPGSPHGTQLNRAAGDVDHTTRGQSLNSADLVTFRLRRSGDQALVRFELNTLLPADATIAALAIDLDDDRSTGGGAWGHGIDIASDGHDVVHVFDRRDADANVIDGRFPIPEGTIKRRDTWRIQAVVALGDGTPMNVAFRGTGETGSWWEGRQAAALAAGDVSAFGAQVTLAALGRPSARTPLAPGFYERVYRSRFSVTDDAGNDLEGVDYAGVPGRGAGAAFGQTFEYLGRVQPYAIYVPPGAPSGGYGLQLVLHGHDAAHASVVNGDGFQRQFGDDLGRVLVSPLGRGSAGGYSDESERDVLDVLDDVTARFPIDGDRVFSSGYSMGGYGAYRMAVLYPDRFAAMVNWVGATGDCLNGTPIAQGDQRTPPPVAPANPVVKFSNDPADRGGCPNTAIGNAFDHLDNLRYVPAGMLYALADELVWANHALALQQRWDRLGYEHVLWLHAAEHLTFAVLDQWDKEARWSAGRSLAPTHQRVTYSVNPWMWNPDLGLRPDGAYWIDDLRPRDLGPNTAKWPHGTLDVGVDLTSHACPDDQRPVVDSTGAGIDPVPWVSQVATPAGEATGVARGNLVSGTMTNVASVTLDARAACLDPRAPVRFDVATDGPVDVRLVLGGGRVRTVRLG